MSQNPEITEYDNNFQGFPGGRTVVNLENGITMRIQLPSMSGPHTEVSLEVPKNSKAFSVLQPLLGFTAYPDKNSGAPLGEQKIAVPGALQPNFFEATYNNYTGRISLTFRPHLRSTEGMDWVNITSERAQNMPAATNALVDWLLSNECVSDKDKIAVENYFHDKSASINRW